MNEPNHTKTKTNKDSYYLSSYFVPSLVLKCFISINSFKPHHPIIISVLQTNKWRYPKGKYLAKISQLEVELRLEPKSVLLTIYFNNCLPEGLLLVKPCQTLDKCKGGG